MSEPVRFFSNILMEDGNVLTIITGERLPLFNGPYFTGTIESFDQYRARAEQTLPSVMVEPTQTGMTVHSAGPKCSKVGIHSIMECEEC